MKVYFYHLGIVLFSLITLSCDSELSKEDLCTNQFRGRVVSNGPACAGVAIQLLAGTVDASRVDASWFDAYTNNPVVYENVFKTFPYCNETAEEVDKLLTVIETGTEFYFILDNPVDDPFCGFGECMVCEPLVSLPEHVNKIRIVANGCSDQVTME